ncbi:DUF6318 family protein [Arthrobacter sp. ATA002]|uniref:DUF6318 family protein n=1 Tax=Arthrobacter sp. ATA002 TaxID=2991715 RepID=UPI0022A74C26|nr:DUF6318 family protein [Arthrobacter sp. ATA002]WAP51276.1 DUF6318 family protein [Arthrobacter sp. ATA002]
MFRSRALSAIPVSVRLSAAGIAAVLILGGCSGSGEPGADAAEASSSASPTGSASPSATTSATATPTPTPTAVYKPATAEGPAENVPLPVMPELAKQESKEGLEAFAEYWYSLINYGYETGDVGPVRTVSSSPCSVCDVYYSTVGLGFKNEDWMAGSMVKVRDLHSDFALTPEGYYQVLIQISQKDLEYYGPNGVDYGPMEGLQLPIVQLIEASHDGMSWRAVRVENI